MDFSWSPEQLEYRNAVAEFAAGTLNVDLESRTRDGIFRRDLWEACAKFGLLGLPVPAEFGGTAQDLPTSVLAMEALGYGCRDQGFLFSLHAHLWAVVMPVLAFATPEMRRRLLPGLIDGTLIGAHAISEPEAGSNGFAMRATARLDGDHYVLDGTKTWVTNAPIADVHVVFATVNAKRGMFGVTGFLIDKGTPGLRVSTPFKKMGLTTSPMSEVILEGCRVPVAQRLGKEGQGAAIFNHSMAWERSCILASQLGGLEHQLESTLKYAKEREQFGKPIGDFQLVASRLVDMKLRLETSRLLLYRTAWRQTQGEDITSDAAMTKLYLSEAAVQSALDAIQIHGGNGYMTEFGVERDLRDAIGGRLYSGTSEIQRLIIARGMGLRP
ncbi:MAG: acyl-CoA dehydrogenase family protein [Gemmatimonadaceae bacterium]